MAGDVLFHGEGGGKDADRRLPAVKIQAHHVLAVPVAGPYFFQHKGGCLAAAVGDKGKIVVLKLSPGAVQSGGEKSPAAHIRAGEGGALVEMGLQIVEGQGAGQDSFLPDQHKKASVLRGKGEGGAVVVPAEPDQFFRHPFFFVRKPGSHLYFHNHTSLSGHSSPFF